MANTGSKCFEDDAVVQISAHESRKRIQAKNFLMMNTSSEGNRINLVLCKMCSVIERGDYHPLLLRQSNSSRSLAFVAQRQEKKYRYQR